MASLDVATFTPVLKAVFPNGDYPKELVYKGSPFLGILPKDPAANGLGEYIKVPMRYGDPQGRSATFATGRANKRASKFKAFQLTTVNDYAFAEIDGETIDRSKGQEGAFAQAVKSEVDAAMRQLKRSAVNSLFGDGGGYLGQIASTSTINTPTITLSDPAQVVWFEVGQLVVASATRDGSGTLKSAGAAVELVAVDRNAGTLTIAGNWTAGIAAIVASDYLFVQGDYGLKMKGLQAWIPPTGVTVTATAFFGVDRTADVQRLAGVNADLTGAPIEEATLSAVELVERAGGEPDTILMHTADFKNFQLSLNTKVRYVETKAFDANVGFTAIEVNLGSSTCRVYADRDCPRGLMPVLDLETWKLYSLGALPKMLNNDGMAVLRTGTTDGVEAQMTYRAQLGCNAPGHNGMFLIG